MLYDQVKEDLQEKIRRLEEDRHNIDITSGDPKYILYYKLTKGIIYRKLVSLSVGNGHVDFQII